MDHNEAFLYALSNRVEALERWRDGEDAGGRLFCIELQNLVTSEAAARRKLSDRLNAHIRGDIDTPLGTLQGPGGLLHEPHPHSQHAVRMTEKQTEELMQGLWKLGTEKRTPTFCPHCGERL